MDPVLYILKDKMKFDFNLILINNNSLVKYFYVIPFILILSSFVQEVSSRIFDSISVTINCSIEGSQTNCKTS
jgi:hypothetical protein